MNNAWFRIGSDVNVHSTYLRKNTRLNLIPKSVYTSAQKKKWTETHAQLTQGRIDIIA